MAAALRRNTVASRTAAGLSLSLLLCAVAIAAPRETVLLWPSGAPGSVVVDDDGHRVADGEQTIDIPPSAEITAATQLRILHPQRWDIDQPRLYSLVTELRERTTVVDRYETPFGVRTVAFDRRHSFGRRSCRGTCGHYGAGHDADAVARCFREAQSCSSQRATGEQWRSLRSSG
jgi:hypothetical protein